MAPIPGPATYAENGRAPPEEYTRVTSLSLSVVPDSPTWPTPQGPIDFAQESQNNFPPWVPAPEDRPTGYRGLYVNHLDPFSVESVWRAVGSGTRPRSGGLSNGLDSEPPCDFSEENPRGPSEDVLVPVVRPPAGQVMSCHSSGGIGARAEIHPRTHVPGRGKYGTYYISERGEEASNGEMNRAE
jgi:hypothetical protein